MNSAWRDGEPGKLFALDLRTGTQFGLVTVVGSTEVCCCFALHAVRQLAVVSSTAGSVPGKLLPDVSKCVITTKCSELIANFYNIIDHFITS